MDHARSWLLYRSLKRKTHLVRTRLVLAFSLPVIDMVARNTWLTVYAVNNFKTPLLRSSCSIIAWTIGDK